MQKENKNPEKGKDFSKSQTEVELEPVLFEIIPEFFKCGLCAMKITWITCQNCKFLGSTPDLLRISEDRFQEFAFLTRTSGAWKLKATVLYQSTSKISLSVYKQAKYMDSSKSLPDAGSAHQLSL